MTEQQNHSTGPNVVSSSSTKTPEGKANCRLKRRFHSSTKLNIFTPEEQQAYDAHSKITLGALVRANDFERDLAQSIADDRWRLKRVRTIESGIFALGMQLGAVQLEAIQTRRELAAKEDMRKAKLLYQVAQAEGRPYEPEPFFTAAPAVRESVFSTDEIVRELARERQYRDASDYAYEGMRPRKFSVTPPKPTATGHRPPAASLTSDR